MNVYLRDRVALSIGKRSMKRAIKMLFGFWFNLKLKVKFSTILVFKAIFLRHKSLKLFLFYFSLNNLEIGEQLLLLNFLITMIFNVHTLLLKMGSIFDF